jgi:hypothetical protein
MRKELWFGFSLMAIILLVVAIFMPWTTMSNGHLGLLMLALVVVAIMLGFPTAFTLMGMGMIFTFFAYWSSNAGHSEKAISLTLELMVQKAFGVMSNDVLISIPLFVFMGYLVERANLIEKLFKSLHLALARIPGSLAVATVFTCAVFATATGIVGAVVTLMGLLALPAMLKAGYDIKLSAGAITAGGCLGILIPPSVMLIVYGRRVLPRHHVGAALHRLHHDRGEVEAASRATTVTGAARGAAADSRGGAVEVSGDACASGAAWRTERSSERGRFEQNNFA